MAVTTRGFDGVAYQFDETQWARYQQNFGILRAKHGVTAGFVVSVDAGTRSVSVSAGTALAPGLLIDSGVAVTLTHVANVSTTNRVDCVVLQSDWATNTTSLAVVLGSSSGAPALTQDAGVLWQMPLALVTVRPSVATFISSDVTVNKPLPRNSIAYRGTVNTATMVAYNGTWTTVSTVPVTDPGWPYHLMLNAHMLFLGKASGYAQMRIVDQTGAVLFISQTPLIGGNAAVTGGTIVPSLSGAKSLSLQIQPALMSSGSNVAPLATGPIFSVQVIPA